MLPYNIYNPDFKNERENVRKEVVPKPTITGHQCCCKQLLLISLIRRSLIENQINSMFLEIMIDHLKINWFRLKVEQQYSGDCTQYRTIKVLEGQMRKIEGSNIPNKT